MKNRPKLTMHAVKNEIIKISRQDIIKSNSLILNSLLIIFLVVIIYYLLSIYLEKVRSSE